MGNFFTQVFNVLRYSFILIVIFFSPISHGDLTTFKFSGTVDHVPPEFTSAISLGERLSGSYTFGTNTPGNNGLYLDPFSTVQIHLDSFQWDLDESPTASLPNAIFIGDDSFADIYDVQIIPDGPSINRYDPERFSITVWDNSGSMFNNSSLSSTPPDILSIPEDNRYWELQFPSGKWIGGTLTSLKYGGSQQSIDYGLFIGANDPKFLNFATFDLNARQLELAFESRPRTQSEYLIGDVNTSPITVEKIKQKLQSIRRKMNPGDSLTLYINNHGGSILFDDDNKPYVNEDNNGIGDEAIYVGVLLYDNQLADLLRDFNGYRVTVFLDSCHSGGFWGGTDPTEKLGLGYNDLNDLNNVTLYAAADEDAQMFGGYVKMTFWGQALLEAFETPQLWTPKGLASFLYKRSKELATWSWQVDSVWYPAEWGEPVTPDISLIQPFFAYSADVDIDDTLFGGPEPEVNFDDLITSVTNKGPGESLASKITNAQAYFDAEDIVTACGELQGFVNQVHAHTGKTISVDDAELFIASAKFLMASIECH